MVLFSAIFTLATACLATATPIVERDAGTDLLITDLLRLDRAIRTITTAANSYTGDAASYQPIRESFSEVNRTNRIAYYDAMTIKPRESCLSLFLQLLFIHVPSLTLPESVPDSDRIIAVVANPIQPDITDAVNALIAKKDLIDAAGFMKETADGLNLISYDHDTLSIVAVAPKLNPATLPAASPPVLAIDLDWRRGVAAFGGVPLAPITM